MTGEDMALILEVRQDSRKDYRKVVEHREPVRAITTMIDYLEGLRAKYN